MWGFRLRVYTLEAGYDFQYGQLVAIIPSITPLYLVCKLIWKKARDRGQVDRAQKPPQPC
ncbi:hypothetical protein CPB86DRAFT_307910 [Serendipita vermifera]|nr:hypothetical protein CPB86DRAFT_307910 [Serendipita vermifera]